MKIISVFLFFFVFASCGKINGDLNGQDEIKGQLLTENPYLLEPAKAALNTQVFIRRKGGDTSTFLYATMTDGTGNFNFTNLDKDSSYVVYSKTLQKTPWDDNVIFRYEQLLKGNAANVHAVMTPDSVRQNELFLTFKDVSGGSVGQDSVFLYTSRILAVNDTGKLQGAGAAHKLQANTYGALLKVNLYYQDSLYINAFGKFDTLTLRSLLTGVKLERTGIVRKSIEMRKK